MRILAILLVGLALVACRSNGTPDPNALPEGPVEATEPTKPVRRVYVGQYSTRSYHVEGCKHLEGVDDGDLVLFESPGEAEDRDWHPCDACKPLADW